MPLIKQVKALRRLGFGFAIDDAGAGYASFTLIAALHPSIIKIDREIAHGIARDDAKQALVEAFVSFGRRIGARLLAEGIEKRSDLAMLTSLGVELGQGYLIGKPAYLPATPRPIEQLRLDAARRTVSRKVARRRPEASPASRHGEVAERPHVERAARIAARVPSAAMTLPRYTALTDRVRRFLAEPRYAAVATIDDDGGPRQAVVWFLLDGDTIVINSLDGRRWPTNLRRDPRVSIAITDAEPRIVGRADRHASRSSTTRSSAQADIAAMARRYHAANPAEAEAIIASRFSKQQRVSFRLRPTSIHDHLEDD